MWENLLVTLYKYREVKLKAQKFTAKINSYTFVSWILLNNKPVE